MLKQAFGNEPTSRTQIYEWYKWFKNGRNSIEDDTHYGRTSTLKADQHFKNVCEVISSNRRLTARVVADDVGISKTSCH
jgi:hypothetical protein